MKKVVCTGRASYVPRFLFSVFIPTGFIHLHSIQGALQIRDDLLLSHLLQHRQGPLYLEIPSESMG